MSNTHYTYEQKCSILLETAKAYYNKGHAIQYDQYSMDRLVRVTPRNIRFAPPEMANTQHMLFLDCTTFIYNLFYQVFGYQLESNLTWQIPNILKPCVYQYTRTGEETREDYIRIRDEILSVLKPGDVLNKVRYSGSGHIVLYAGDGMIYHSTSSVFPDSYQYKSLKEGIYEHGTIHYNSIDNALDIGGVTPSIFAKDIQSVQILRPLELMGDPLPWAISRWSVSKDLSLSVLSSHSGSKTAMIGDKIIYTLEISNLGTETRTAEAVITETPQLKLIEGKKRLSLEIYPGETVTEDFIFTFVSCAEPVCPAPCFVVNEIPVWAERVLVAPYINPEKINAVISNVSSDSAEDLYTQVVASYEKIGITMPPTPFRLLFPCFRLIDSAGGDVLWRLPQRPTADMSLYSYFGGTGVITPELNADCNIRVQKLWANAFQPGDLVLISEDAIFSKIHCFFFTGDGVLTHFAGQSICKITAGEELNKLIETLPGRFCYITFRPQQLTGQSIDQANPHPFCKY